MSGNKSNKCCVPGCEDQTSKRHRFPVPSKDPETFELWLQKVQNPLLFSKTKEQVRKTYVVCDRHFKDEVKLNNRKGIWLTAIPELFLPESKENIVVDGNALNEEKPTGEEGTSQSTCEYPGRTSIGQSSAPHIDDEKNMETQEIKIEEVDIVHQFIDENSIQDSKEYRIQNNFYDVKNSFEIDTSDHQDDIDSNISKPSSEESTGALKDSFRTLNQKVHKCGVCGFTTDNPHYLKRHVVSIHLKIKNYKCHFCDYKASYENLLKVHIDCVHLKLKKFKCNLCDFESFRKISLKNHIDSVHLNLKKYKCNWCNFASIYNKSLKRHIESVHMNSKQHQCQFCDYACNQKISLQRHMRSLHQDIIKHVCNLCQKEFNTKRELKAHITSVHLNLKHFKCDPCGYSTNDQAELTRHLNSVHLNTEQFKCNFNAKKALETPEEKIAGIDTSQKYEEHSVEQQESQNSSSGVRDDFKIDNNDHQNISGQNCDLETPDEIDNIDSSQKSEEHNSEQQECWNSSCGVKDDFKMNIDDYQNISELNSAVEAPEEIDVIDVSQKCKELNDKQQESQYSSSEVKDHSKIDNSDNQNISGLISTHEISSSETEEKFIVPEQKPHKCNLCDFSTDDLECFQRHESSVHSQCDYVASQKTKQRKHKKKGGPNKEFVCHLCDKVVKTNWYLKIHIDSVHLKLKRYKCHMCDHASYYKTRLEEHIQAVHLNLKPEKCPQCDFAAHRKLELDRHFESVHVKIRKYLCDSCNYAATCRRNLWNHMKNVHVKLPKKYKCNLCEFSTKLKHGLKGHVDTVHLNLMKYKCVLCDYACKRSVVLKKHLVSAHMDLKVFKCEFCDYAANENADLKIHIKTVHLETKQYACHLCEKVFDIEKDLKSHVECVHLT